MTHEAANGQDRVEAAIRDAIAAIEEEKRLLEVREARKRIPSPSQTVISEETIYSPIEILDLLLRDGLELALKWYEKETAKTKKAHKPRGRLRFPEIIAGENSVSSSSRSRTQRRPHP